MYGLNQGVSVMRDMEKFQQSGKAPAIELKSLVTSMSQHHLSFHLYVLNSYEELKETKSLRTGLLFYKFLQETYWSKVL